MRYIHFILTAIIACFLFGCASHQTMTIKELPLDTLYGKRKLKTYIFIENTENVNEAIKTAGYNCRQIIFDHNAGKVYSEVIRKAASTAFEDVEFVNAIPKKQQSGNFRVITISADHPFVSSYTVGLYSIQQKAAAIYKANVSVFDPSGNRVAYWNISGQEQKSGDDGVLQCGTEEKTLSPAISVAIQRFGNNLIHAFNSLRP